MSENLDHETGGTFANEDIVTAQSGNTKFITVQSAAPTTNYDGSIFIDTDNNPPYLNIRDATNTQWMEHHSREYTTATQTRWPVVYGQLYSNGNIISQYDSSLSKTKLHVKANGIWWGVVSV